MQITGIRAINRFGKRHQLSVAQEELAELIQAISKYNRSLDNQFDKEKAKQMIIEEMADVTIMMAQLIDITEIKQSQIDAAIKLKTLRMEERLNKSQEENKNMIEQLKFIGAVPTKESRYYTYFEFNGDLPTTADMLGFRI